MIVRAQDEPPAVDVQLLPANADIQLKSDTHGAENDIVGGFVDAPNLSAGLVGRGTLERPDEYWEQNGYPDNISFASEGGGELLDDGTNILWLIIGIVNADESSKQDIINLVAPSCLVTFVECTYTYAQRKMAYDDISSQVGGRVASVYMMRGSEDVFVEFADGQGEEYAQELVEKYGRFVKIASGIGAGDNDDVSNATIAEPKPTKFWLISAILLLLAALAAVGYKTRKRTGHIKNKLQ
jgi:hypothetical protein